MLSPRMHPVVGHAVTPSDPDCCVLARQQQQQQGRRYCARAVTAKEPRTPPPMQIPSMRPAPVLCLASKPEPTPIRWPCPASSSAPDGQHQRRRPLVDGRRRRRRRRPLPAALRPRQRTSWAAARQTSSAPLSVAPAAAATPTQHRQEQAKQERIAALARAMTLCRSCGCCRRRLLRQLSLNLSVAAVMVGWPIAVDPRRWQQSKRLSLMTTSW